jgi:hypothetical protein
MELVVNDVVELRWLSYRSNSEVGENSENHDGE